ncbi:MAG: hypothetical protein K6A70_05395 [Erysipelotrichaceae bacterium]|nr:hypothetical protein [Erysipelotrichaceae bacterium]
MNLELKDYMRELILMEKQYGQEEELYPLINMLLRENENVKELSVRDVHGSRGSGMVHSMLYGYASFPDLVILDEKCDLNLDSMKSSKQTIDDQVKNMYGCVEAKQYKEVLSFWGEGDDIEIERKDISKCTYKIGNTFPRPDQCFYCVTMDETLPKKYYNCNCPLIIYDVNIEDESSWVNGVNGKRSKFRDIKGAKEESEKIALKIYENDLCGIKENLLCARPSEQLIGELLWYGKVLYTNGIVWKYLELKNPDKDTIRDKYQLCGFVRKKSAEWIKTLDGKKITVMCVEIGNLTDAYENLVTKAEEDKLAKLKDKFKLNDEEVKKWNNEWEQLKIKLGSIKWTEENFYDQFITEEDTQKNEPTENPTP